MALAVVTRKNIPYELKWGFAHPDGGPIERESLKNVSPISGHWGQLKSGWFARWHVQLEGYAPMIGDWCGPFASNRDAIAAAEEDFVGSGKEPVQ